MSVAFLAGVNTRAARARWCGVWARSWRSMVLAPTRSREITLLLGAQQVREPVVEVPDFVEHGELGGGVETQVANEAADVGPVLLLDAGAVILVARAAAGERDLVRDAVVVEVRVDEL